jgi:hypothetical protein
VRTKHCGKIPTVWASFEPVSFQASHSKPNYANALQGQLNSGTVLAINSIGKRS